MSRRTTLSIEILLIYNIFTLTDLEVRQQAEAYLNQATEAQYVSNIMSFHALNILLLRYIIFLNEYMCVTNIRDSFSSLYASN